MVENLCLCRQSANRTPENGARVLHCPAPMAMSVSFFIVRTKLKRCAGPFNLFEPVHGLSPLGVLRHGECAQRMARRRACRAAARLAPLAAHAAAARAPARPALPAPARTHTTHHYTPTPANKTRLSLVLYALGGGSKLVILNRVLKLHTMRPVHPRLKF
ncbi:hypothetical protein EVAR_103156_1 [Eumeta japonica]|uniref:Uncharacterized protein n=1 Tax=Eumeta variegata TaxID=151549 RepID=A0A4C1YFV4_EUMVA|nr:hypothetical protein EVAR_103156_1 [Eumeta japonica]